MANAEVDGVELELEVSFNEFDDETIADENAGENKNRASEIPSAVCKVALDDGEILDTVVGRSGVHANGNSPARDSNSNQFSGNTKADRTNELQRLKDGREPRGANTTMREQRKRKLSCSMEVDDEPGVDRGNKGGLRCNFSQISKEIINEIYSNPMLVLVMGRYYNLSLMVVSLSPGQADDTCWCNMLRAFGHHVAQCCISLANPA